MRVAARVRSARRRRSGFTLAEVAVTLVIVGMTLLLVMKGLSSSRVTAAAANNRKIAMQLALLTIGRVESGVLWEELDGVTGTFEGTYAEEGYETFRWELIVGDEDFREEEPDPDDPYFDNYAYRRYRDQELDLDDADEEAFSATGTTGGPFERVVVRVSYPKLTDQPSEYVLERWIPLRQVFGLDPDAGVPLDEGDE